MDTVRNVRDEPIVFELHRQWPGDIELESEIDTKLFDYRTAEVRFPVRKRNKLAYPCTILQHHGRNAGQSRIRMR